MLRFSLVCLAGVSLLAALSISGCGSDKGTNPEDTLVLSGSTWALSSLEGAPGSVSANNSVWNFRPDGTYDWFLRYTPYFDLSGRGTYRQERGLLHVTGIFRETVIGAFKDDFVGVSGSSDSFRFRDDEGDEWVYTRIPDPEIAFASVPSYTGDCQNRPPGTVCLRYSDGYVRLIHDSIVGGERPRLYWRGQPLATAVGAKADYYHVLGTDLVGEKAR